MRKHIEVKEGGITRPPRTVTVRPDSDSANYTFYKCLCGVYVPHTVAAHVPYDLAAGIIEKHPGEVIRQYFCGDCLNAYIDGEEERAVD